MFEIENDDSDPKAKAKQAISAALAMVNAVQGLFQLGFYHGDLRSENFIPQEDGTFQLTESASVIKVGAKVDSEWKTTEFTHPQIASTIELIKSLQENPKKQPQLEYAEKHEAYSLSCVLQEYLKDFISQNPDTSVFLNPILYRVFTDQFISFAEGAVYLNKALEAISSYTQGEPLGKYRRQFDEASNKDIHVQLLLGINKAVQEFHVLKGPGNYSWQLNNFMIYEKDDKIIVGIKEPVVEIKDKKSVAVEIDEVMSLAEILSSEETEIVSDENMQTLGAINGSVKSLREFYTLKFDLAEDIERFEGKMAMKARVQKIEENFVAPQDSTSVVIDTSYQKPYRKRGASDDDSTISTNSEDSNKPEKKTTPPPAI